MAREDSVRGAVERIDKRTSDLAPVLEKISDSLDRIGKSFSPKKEETKKESREGLLAKFSPAENFNEKLAKETNENEIVLNQIKEVIERNHKESFKVFQNMENFLKVIAVEGGTGGGGLPIPDIDLDKPSKGPAGATKKAGGVLSKALRFASKAALPLAAGMAAFDAVGGYGEAKENLGIEGREATFGEKLSSGAGAAVSGLTFGLLDKGATSRGIASFFGAGPDKEPKPSLEEQKKILKKDGSGFKTPEQLKAEGLDPVTGKPLPKPAEPKAVAPTPILQSDVKSAATRGTLPSAAATVAAAMTTTPTIAPPAPPTPPAAPTVTPPAPPTPPAAPKVEAKPATKVPAKPASPVVEKKENPEVKKLQDEYFAIGKEVKELNNNFAMPRDEFKKKRKELNEKAAAIVEKLEKIEPGAGNLGGLGDYESSEQFQAVTKAHQEEDLKNEAKLASGDYEKTDEGAIVKKPSAQPVTPVMKQQTISTTTSTKESVTKGEVKTAEASAAQDQISGLDQEYAGKANEIRKKLVAEGKLEEGEILTSDMYESIPELKALQEEKASKKAKLEKSIVAGTSQTITPVTSTSSQTMSNLTGENKELLEGVHNKAVQPVVITNNNTTSSNQQSVAPMRTSPRPTNNSFERKQNQMSSY